MCLPSLLQKRRPNVAVCSRSFLPISHLKQSLSSCAKKVLVTVTSAKVHVVMVTALVVSAKMAHVAKVAMQKPIVLAVSSLTHHQSCHSARKQNEFVRCASMSTQCLLNCQRHIALSPRKSSSVVYRLFAQLSKSKTRRLFRKVARKCQRMVSFRSLSNCSPVFV